MNTLIVGGTKGLGIETARLLVGRGESVTVTGREDPHVEGIDFYEQDLALSDLDGSMQTMIASLPVIDRLIYNAGVLHEDTLTDFTPQQVLDMNSIGLIGLELCARAILEEQTVLDQIITITSTSQFTPRELETTYNGVKAGAAHFTHGLSLDKGVKKALVIAPAGMASGFYKGSGRDDLSDMMNPTDVAVQVVKLIDQSSETEKKFNFALIMRKPQKVYTNVPTHGDLIRHITMGTQLELDKIVSWEF